MDTEGREWETCALAPKVARRFAGREFDEIRDYLALRRCERKAATSEIQQHNADFNAQRDRITTEETKKTDEALAKAGMIKRDLIYGIRESRQIQKSHERKFGQNVPSTAGEEPQSESSTPPPAPEVAVLPLPKSPDPKGYVPLASATDLLRNSRERTHDAEKKEA